MYVGRVACCILVNRGEYANGTDRQTDGRQTVTLRFPLNAACIIKKVISAKRGIAGVASAMSFIIIDH